MIEVFIGGLTNPEKIPIESKCELLLTAHELKLRGNRIDKILNDISILSINEISLPTALIRQIVINKYIRKLISPNSKKQIDCFVVLFVKHKNHGRCRLS